MLQVLAISNYMSKEATQKFTIKLYTDHKYLWVKHTTYRKAESFRAGSLSKLDSMVNSNPIFNAKCDKFSTNWFELFNFHKPTCTCNHTYNLHQKSISAITSANFHLFISCYMFTKPSLRSQLTLPFLIPQQFLSPFSLAQPCLQFLHKKAFSWPQPWKSLESWLCFNICLLPWSMDRKKGPKSIYSSLLKLRKLVRCRKSTFTHISILLPLLPYPTNTIRRTNFH